MTPEDFIQRDDELAWKAVSVAAKLGLRVPGDLSVIAPWRIWDLRSREDCLAYAAKHHVPVAATAAKIYSRDRNIWHISHEGGVLEDPNSVPPKDGTSLAMAGSSVALVQTLEANPGGYDASKFGWIGMITRTGAAPILYTWNTSPSKTFEDIRDRKSTRLNSSHT